MIAETIKYICDEFNLDPDNSTQPFSAEPGDVARLESGTALKGDLDKNIVVTLVNIEEEKTLKNGSHYIQNGDALNKRNPTVFINLYLLFSCSHGDYLEALKRISMVILFFQGKNVFTKENSDGTFPSDVGVEKIILDLFTLNFEQINHLWGILGGKHTPSVLYKLRIVAVQKGLMEKIAVVKEVKANANQN